jgi:predicted nucleic acid-binding protein
VVLVDTSILVEHLRRGHPGLIAALDADDVCMHPFIVGEIACGNLHNRSEVLTLLTALPQVPVAEHAEVLRMIEARDLAGGGLGWVDMHLLASALLAGVGINSLDRRLSETVARIGIGDT